METTKIALFKGRKIRRIIYQNKWWFSVIDIIEALTDSVNPRDYWFKRIYEILTAEISKATFGITPSEYKKHKELERQNLRDQ